MPDGAREVIERFLLELDRYHYERDILEEIDTNFNRVRVAMLGLAPEDWSGEY